MTVIRQGSKVDELIRRLDEAVAIRDDEVRCRNVKRVLSDVVESGEDFLDASYLLPTPDVYARRLLHRDPEGRYSALVMVWDKGQGTPLHDHAGMWCVECVYRGKIRVTSFSLQGDPEAELVGFKQEEIVLAGVGEAGARNPPFASRKLQDTDAGPDSPI